MSTAEVTTVIVPSASTRQTAAAGSVAARPVARRHADALVLGQRIALRPERVLAQALEHLDGADRRERVPADADVALDDRVLQAQLDRVEVELLRQLVEQRLEREGGGRRARRAVGAEGEAVRLHAVAAEVVRLPAVRPGDEQRA